MQPYSYPWIPLSGPCTFPLMSFIYLPSNVVWIQIINLGNTIEKKKFFEYTILTWQSFSLTCHLGRRDPLDDHHTFPSPYVVLHSPSVHHEYVHGDDHSARIFLLLFLLVLILDLPDITNRPLIGEMIKRYDLYHIQLANPNCVNASLPPRPAPTLWCILSLTLQTQLNWEICWKFLKENVFCTMCTKLISRCYKIVCPLTWKIIKIGNGSYEKWS